MTKNNGEFIGVKHFDELASVIHGRVTEFVGEEPIDYEVEYSLENYKSAFETLAKHVRGYAEAHDDGSLLWSIMMESTQDADEESFLLIQQALSKKGEN
ncbi:hypothetical protein ABET51_06625 [Metabacillus fastidiosus]|uniref:hypothetical protein n=1 Tax=Metabacillus fastidiosus TaxID=1458 RepID=UPI003D2DDE8F